MFIFAALILLIGAYAYIKYNKQDVVLSQQLVLETPQPAAQVDINQSEQQNTPSSVLPTATDMELSPNVNFDTSLNYTTDSNLNNTEINVEPTPSLIAQESMCGNSYNYETIRKCFPRLSMWSVGDVHYTIEPLCGGSDQLCACSGNEVR